MRLVAVGSLVAVALAAGGCGAARLSVNERAGTIKRVGIGSTADQVFKQFGKPGTGGDAYPIEPSSDDADGSGGPWSVDTGPFDEGPEGCRHSGCEQTTLRYRDT